MYDDSFKTRYRFVPIAIYENKSGGDTQQHIHRELEMVLICEGAASCTVGEHTFRAQKGDMIFVNPLEVHSYNTADPMDYNHKCICIDMSLVAEPTIGEAVTAGAMKICHHVRHADAVLRDLFHNLYDAVENNTSTLLLESAAYVSLLFAYLIKNALLTDSRKDEKARLFCTKVLSVISQNFMGELSSKFVAEQLFYTQSYFCRTFKANFGIPFSTYLNMYRIQVARKMLLTSDLKVSQIAFECGFQNTVYFNRLFKKQVGVTPIQYRRSK